MTGLLINDSICSGDQHQRPHDVVLKFLFRSAKQCSMENDSCLQLCRNAVLALCLQLKAHRPNICIHSHIFFDQEWPRAEFQLSDLLKFRYQVNWLFPFHIVGLNRNNMTAVFWKVQGLLACHMPLFASPKKHIFLFRIHRNKPCRFHVFKYVFHLLSCCNFTTGLTRTLSTFSFVTGPVVDFALGFPASVLHVRGAA